MSHDWNDFVGSVSECKTCAPFGLVNILDGTPPGAPWGLPWYDDYRHLDGGLMIVGMDFGNEETTRQQRAFRERNPRWMPDEQWDKSYVRLSRFLNNAGLSHDAFLTNAALCVRAGNAQETNALPSTVYSNCSTHLRKQIAIARPYVIGALGNDALDFTCDALRVPREKQGVTKIAGKQILARVNKAVAILVPLIHPSRRQDAHGWSDERQLDQLFKPLKHLLDERRRILAREAYIADFGVLN